MFNYIRTGRWALWIFLPHLQLHGMVYLTSEQWPVQMGRTFSMLHSFSYIYIYDIYIYMIVHAICDHPRVLFVTSLQTLFNWFELFVNRIVGLRLNFNTNRSKLSTCIKHYQSIYFFGGGEPPWGVFESCRPRSLCMATWVEPNPPWEASSRGKCGGRGRLGEPRFGWILEALNGPFGNPNFG